MAPLYGCQFDTASTLPLVPITKRPPIRRRPGLDASHQVAELIHAQRRRADPHSPAAWQILPTDEFLLDPFVPGFLAVLPAIQPCYFCQFPQHRVIAPILL